MLIGSRSGWRVRRRSIHSASVQANLRLSHTMEAFCGAGSKKKPYGSVLSTTSPEAFFSSNL